MISVSVAVPAPFATELQRLRASFGDPSARTIPTHVTLLSPTQIADEDGPQIHEHLRRVAQAQKPFTMLLRSTGTFRPVSRSSSSRWPVASVRVSGSSRRSGPAP